MPKRTACSGAAQAVGGARGGGLLAPVGVVKNTPPTSMNAARLSRVSHHEEVHRYDQAAFLLRCEKQMRRLPPTPEAMERPGIWCAKPRAGNLPRPRYASRRGRAPRATCELGQHARQHGAKHRGQAAEPLPLPLGTPTPARRHGGLGGTGHGMGSTSTRKDNTRHEPCRVRRDAHERGPGSGNTPRWTPGTPGGMGRSNLRAEATKTAPSVPRVWPGNQRNPS
jgi:hypothetical protein